MSTPCTESGPSMVDANAPSHSLAWLTHAACLGSNPDVFYPAQGEDDRPAKRICSTCPVRDACLEDSLIYGTREAGIKGGMSSRQRSRLLRDRRRAAA